MTTARLSKDLERLTVSHGITLRGYEPATDLNACRAYCQVFENTYNDPLWLTFLVSMDLNSARVRVIFGIAGSLVLLLLLLVGYRSSGTPLSLVSGSTRSALRHDDLLQDASNQTLGVRLDLKGDSVLQDLLMMHSSRRSSSSIYPQEVIIGTPYHLLQP